MFQVKAVLLDQEYSYNVEPIEPIYGYEFPLGVEYDTSHNTLIYSEGNSGAIRGKNINTGMWSLYQVYIMSSKINSLSWREILNFYCPL